MLPDLELLIQLQGLDLRAAELQREIATLPKQVAGIEQQLESHQKQLDRDRALVAANVKERKQHDLDIQTHQQKISKLRDQMMSAKTNEQYRAFQHEIEFCEKEVRKREDRLVELMVSLEEQETSVKAGESALQREKQVVDKQKSEAQARTAEDQKALAAILAERKEVLPKLSPASATLFARLNKRHGAHVVSDATQGRCRACQMELRPQLFQDLRRGEKLFVCETCGRVLHYNPPVAFEAQLGGPGPAGTRIDMT